MEPTDHIMQVRSNINNMPKAIVDDDVILTSIRSAIDFLDLIKYESLETTNSRYIKGVEKLAAFYSYVDYTSRIETDDGRIPKEVFAKLDTLRTIALSFIQLLTPYPLNNNLTVDMKTLREIKLTGNTTTSSVILGD